MNPLGELRPDVFFLPLAVSQQERFAGVMGAGVGAEVLARRIPDFLRQLVNGGQAGPAVTLELYSPADEGPVRWVTLEEPPSGTEAFEMLAEDEDPLAVVTGTLEPGHEGLVVTLLVHQIEDLEEETATQVRGIVTLTDPVAGLKKLAARLAKVLDVPFELPPPHLLTSNGAAFFRFLQGLDGAALLSGDLQIEVGDATARLMQPFAEALRLDPGFGLALRTAHSTLADALEGARVEAAACYEVLDRCFSALPSDGDACVQVAEHLVVLGDDRRAIRWLEHAAHLNPPPAKGLENLGILKANQGETIAARGLWLQGLEVDGHPDFFAHLARLAFSEDNANEGWDKVLRGLRRIYERCVRPGEWEGDERGIGVLLRYLVEHLAEHKPPPDVLTALSDLRGILPAPEDRADLGSCLLELGRRDEARQELEAALAQELEPAARDVAVRSLLNLEVPEFEKRFRTAVDLVTGGKASPAVLRELESFLAVRADFWPARFFLGVALQRSGEALRALDLFAEVLQQRPGQPDVLHEMALLFDRRGNSKRALECIEEALEERSDDVQLLANQALFLSHLGRTEDARRVLEDALEIAPNDADLRKLLRELT